MARALLRWFSAPSALPMLFALFLLVRVAILLIPVVPSSDAQWYFGAASRIAAGLGYSERNILTAFWPPGWPGMLAMIFNFSGPSVLAAQIFNLFLCATASAWLTYDIGRRVFRSELTGRFALLLFAVYPNNAAYVALIMTEVFFTFLLLLGCWLLFFFRNSWALIAAGIVFGLSMLVKAQALVIVLLLLGYQWLRDQANRRGILNHATLVTAVALLIIVPWTVRNYLVFGEIVVVSTNGGLTLLTGNNPSAQGDYTQDDPLVNSIYRDIQNQVEVDREAKRRALAWIRENPIQFVKLVPLKIWRLWAPDGESEWAFQAGYIRYSEFVFFFRLVRYCNQAYYVLLIIGFLVAGYYLVCGSYRALPPPTYWWIAPYIIAAFLTAIAVIFSGQSRFHYPVMPFVMMTCGWLITRSLMIGRYQDQVCPADYPA